MVTDYLIVGQGLAGSLLANALEERGQSIIVIDEGSGAQCSRVAAGTFHPMAFRRMVTTWMAEPLIKELKATFSRLSDRLSIPLIHNRELLKIFGSEDEKARWVGRSHDAEVIDFMGAPLDQLSGPSGVAAPHGFGLVHQAGNIRMKAFLNSYRNDLKKRGRLIESDFTYDELKIDDAGVRWKDLSAKKILFCQGVRNRENPFFADLPIQSTKGEVALVTDAKFDHDQIIHGGMNLVPMEEKEYWLGATYHWNDDDPAPTAKGIDKLHQTYLDMTGRPPDKQALRVGFRPTVKDRRPVIGLHKDHQAIGIFNGLGTKGVLLGPYFSAHFAEYLIQGKALFPEVNVNRFR